VRKLVLLVAVPAEGDTRNADRLCRALGDMIQWGGA
jgi:hypothetical protein